jgi:hypothetical protein
MTASDRAPWHHAVNLDRLCRCGTTIMKVAMELSSALWAAQSNGARSHLNGNEEGCACIALCAFKGAQIEARFVRLNAGQPHWVAASRAVQNSELRNTINWIGLSRQHDTPLKTWRERDTLSHRLLPMMGGDRTNIRLGFYPRCSILLAFKNRTLLERQLGRTGGGWLKK